MRVYKQETFTAQVYGDDIEIGDPIHFWFVPPLTPVDYMQTELADVGDSVHGVAVTDAKVGEFVTVRLGNAGTVHIKTEWTGDLTPGTRLYAPVNKGYLTSSNSIPENLMGYYVGADTLPESDCYSRVEVLLVRIMAATT